MSETVTIALVGISGFGRNHVNRLLDKAEGRNIRLVGAIDPYPDRCERLQDLKDAGADLYASLEEFYDTGGQADLVIISSPIHFHARQTIMALRNGSNVLCEKPAAAAIQDAIKMAETAEDTGKLAAIGYQWSFSPAVQELKLDVMKGILGRPSRLKSLISWPRPASYYRDRHWAARLKSEDGAWVLDSPVHNATAHYLHNCFYILGDKPKASAMPAFIQAELYRANPIQNYDTAMLRAFTSDGAEILHFVSHAVPSNIGPVISYEFEKATVSYERQTSSTFIARFKDGRVKSYGNPEDGGAAKCWTTVEAVREGKSSLCDVRAAIPQMLCANGAQESMEVMDFPQALIRRQGNSENPLTFVQGLQDALVQCFNLGILPYESGGIPWACESENVNLEGYEEFPAHRTGGLS